MEHKLKITPSKGKQAIKTHRSCLSPQVHTIKKPSRNRIESTCSNRMEFKPANEEAIGKEKDLSICLQLLQDQRKESEELAIKNNILSYTLRQKSQDFDLIKSELSSLKLELKRKKTKKEQVKENQGQNHHADHKSELSSQSRQTHNENNFKKPEIKAKSCSSCLELHTLLQLNQNKYSTNLSLIQSQLKEQERTLLLVSALEKQVSQKNSCIDFLAKKLDAFEQNAVDIFEITGVLEQRLQELEMQNNLLRGGKRRLEKDESIETFSQPF